MLVSYNGGCLCGALRYENSSAPIESGYCHCHTCQRSTGAIFLAYASFPVTGFRYSTGVPSIYQSSEHGHREFCSNCGTQITFRESVGATTIDISTGSLDEPAAATPEFHIWCKSKLPWLEIVDDLPRYSGDGPDGI